MNIDFNNKIDEYNQYANTSSTLLKDMLAVVSSGNVPSKESMIELDESIESLRKEYNDICGTARQFLNINEMPVEGSAVDAYRIAVENSKANRIRAQMDSIKETLNKFITVQSPVSAYSESLAPFQKKAEEIISLISNNESEEMDTFNEEAKNALIFINTLECQDLDSDEGLKLLGEIEKIYPKRIEIGLSRQKYYIPAIEIIKSTDNEISIDVKMSEERANIAFKCNYCDGGASSGCIGFKDVCSDIMINYNINKAKHIWCASDALCKQYLDGKMSKEELKEQFSCYESHMLTEWKASAGVIQNGKDKGRPLKLMKVKNHSLAVLTTRLPEAESDEKRIIFAVFLVDESYEGDGREEGHVTNNSKWRIELKPDEARQMLFWNYYWNRNNPKKIVFGSGLHRYLTDMQAAQILRDIVTVKTNPEEKAFAVEFLEYFCKSAGLDIGSIEDAEGALKR